MTSWTPDELATLGEAEELEIASRRADGTLRKWVIIWAVRSGDGIYVRSANGADAPWYVRAMATGEGRIRSGGVESDVTFEDAADADNAAIDEVYHAKYDRYGAPIVDPVTGEHRWNVTIRLVPKS